MMVRTAAKRVARWGLYVGFIFGALYSVGGLIYDAATTGLNRGTALAFGALIGMPVLFAAAGFVVGAVFAMAARAFSKADNA